MPPTAACPLDPRASARSHRVPFSALASAPVRARAWEVNQGVQTALGPWGELFRTRATHGVSLATAASAPTLDLAGLITLGKLGAWICAFDDLADGASIDDDGLDLRIAQYEALTAGDACPELAFDPIARLFLDVLEDLRSAPLGPSLWPLFSRQLSESLRAMQWERDAMARRSARERVPLEVYLHHASDSVCVAIVATAAAMLLGERAVLDRLPALVTAQRHSCAAVRIANDEASWRREQQEGSANVRALGLDEAELDLDQRTAAELAGLELSLIPLRLAAPNTCDLIQRLTDVLVTLYRSGDLDSVQ